MTLTLDDIESRKEQLRQEILERECLLAALEVLHKHATGARGVRTIDVSAFLPALLGPIEPAPARELALLPSPPPAPAPKRPRPPEPYMHPELEKMGLNARTTDIVQWAIARLTGDYTLQDVRALLVKEGRPLKGAEISVVLSRLKQRGEITEIRRGNGRTPAIFRKPPPALAEETPTAA